MSGRKNLVMGLWARSPFEGLEQFLASLWHTSFHGDVCVFVDEVAPALVAALLNHGIIVERLDRLAVPRMHDQSSRYFNYLDFLARHNESYANVMIADLRDLIFQSDPFEKPLPRTSCSPRSAARLAIRRSTSDAWKRSTARQSRIICATARYRVPAPRSARCPACCATSPR
jgi:hypothetical protein